MSADAAAAWLVGSGEPPSSPTMSAAAAAGGGEPPSSPTNADFAASPAPHLPADVLASVLNFLPFSDVRPALLAGKHIAVHAANSVDTLNITNPLEMNVLGFASGRFRQSVRKINIGCLHTRYSGESITNVSAETVARTVPFLSSFPNLEGARITGIWFSAVGNRVVFGRENFFIGWQESDELESAITLMEGLVLSFCGAFKCGTLPRNFDLRGLVVSPSVFGMESHQAYRCPRGGNIEGCKMCRFVCESFPLHIVGHMHGRANENDIVTSPPSPPGDPTQEGEGSACAFCIGDNARLEIMKKRREWKTYAASYNHPIEAKLYAGAIETLFEDFFQIDVTDQIIEEVSDMLRDEGFDSTMVLSISGNMRSAIESLVSNHGFQPRNISSTMVCNCLRQHTNGTGAILLEKESYDWLASRGFQVDTDRIVVVGRDDWNELPRLARWRVRNN